MTFDLTEILMPPVLALIFLLFALLYGRLIRGSRTFTGFMRVLTVYGCI